MSERVLPRHYSRSCVLEASCERAFEFLDDFERLGAHMMNSSWMMAGSRMGYEFDALHGRGVGARVWLKGMMLGFPLTVDEQVVEYEPPVFKSWITIGTPRILIMDEYRMGFSLEPQAQGTRVEVFIEYALPQRAPARWAGWMLAGIYARWCVNSMITGVTREFGTRLHPPRATDTIHPLLAHHHTAPKR